ncbi:hypothetical protein TNCV_4389801 [Trichonephila clavipes]|nr:hypothetical protein TNCV_4389801 [Trichonephila clavipes]
MHGQCPLDSESWSAYQRTQYAGKVFYDKNAGLPKKSPKRQGNVCLESPKLVSPRHSWIGQEEFDPCLVWGSNLSGLILVFSSGKISKRRIQISFPFGRDAGEPRASSMAVAHSEKPSNRLDFSSGFSRYGLAI